MTAEFRPGTDTRVHEVHGFAKPGFERVGDAFAATLTDPRSGAALAIRIDGETVVDLWGGVADERDGREWQASTPSTVFSCTKGLVSILMAHLVSSGVLDYEAKVTDYWAEYGSNGKGETLIRHLLSHRAGISAPRIDLSLDDILDWNRVVGILEAQEPIWPPGSGWGYHAVTHGWLNGEVIRRITGTSVGAFFRDLITNRLGADAWIGLPQELIGTPARLRVIAPVGGDSSTPHTLNPTSGGPVSSLFTHDEWMDRAMTLGGALPGLVSSDRPDFNDPRIQMAEIPGAGGIATARALATIWSATVVETEGLRLLDDDTIQAATVVQSEGPSVFSREAPPHPRWAMGFMLDSARRRFLGDQSFGHDGAGGQVGFADSAHRVGFGFITNRLETGKDDRAPSIIEALKHAIG